MGRLRIGWWCRLSILLSVLVLFSCVHRDRSGPSHKPVRFLSHWINKDAPLTVVILGDSVSTSTAHTTMYSVDEQRQRPPMLISHNVASGIYNILNRGNLTYRRFDSPNVFVETGTNWRSFFGYPRGLGTDDQDNRPGETRMQKGADACSVSFVISADTKICNFIYRTTLQGSPDVFVRIDGGKGIFEVFDVETLTWVEADRYTFSMREIDEGIHNGNTRYQERLKLRRRENLPACDTTVTIGKPAENVPTSFTYWGIEYGGGDPYVSVINEARGAGDIMDLRSFINDTLDERDVDLVIFQVPLINMMSRKSRTPQQQWELFYDLVLSEKPYSLRSKSDDFTRFELVVWTPYEDIKFIKPNGHYRSIFPGNGKRYTSFDYHYIFTKNLMNRTDLYFIDIYTKMMSDALLLYGDPYTAFKKGELTDDGTHLNDKGTSLLLGHLLELFKTDARKRSCFL